MRGVVCLLLHACDLQRGAGRLVPGSRLEHGRDLPRSCHVLWAPSQPCRRLVPISLIRPICVSYLRLLRCTSAACMASWSTSTAVTMSLVLILLSAIPSVSPIQCLLRAPL
eukprot:scaffold311873_cov23-Tisochrysis_lutea.AAC.1